MHLNKATMQFTRNWGVVGWNFSEQSRGPVQKHKQETRVPYL